MTRTRQALVVVALLLAPGRSFAQPLPFANLGLALNLGDRVRVVDGAGARHAHRGDPVLNGLVIGALSGCALGVAFVNGFSDHVEPASSYVLMGGILGGAGAGLGGLVDALHDGERTVYAAPATPATVAAVVTRRAVGVAASWRW